ncbi:MAG: type VI secretion system membrane subunit TssM [Pyrinomonadaceae bacterium]|nr:type VI secretion system membrane subunit TssM [Pyrinomonadaceae bacterium]
MSGHGDQLKYALGISSLVTFYGIASLIVFYLGPQFGFGLTYQIVLVALILLTLPFALVINSVRKRRARKREAAAAGAEDAAGEDGKKGKASSAPSRAFEELSRGAEEAVQWLRSTQLGAQKSGDAVYALPWYVTAGPLKSGKTSLLLSSGLDFQTLPSQRRAESTIVRPTRNCEWRVTDVALLLDTAGRYQNDSPDRDEWAALSETLRKYRGERPVDGFLLAVSASGVLRLSETDIEQQAKILRARLDDVMQRVKNRFPVYLIFTNADTIEGFGNFFDASRREGKAEVWGATIPLEKSVNAHAMFDAEFDLLYGSLVRHRFLRLAVPAKPAQKLRVFSFPSRFSEARRKLGLFTSVLFRPNPFSESPLLRGFYFTATLTDGADGGGREREVAPVDGMTTTAMDREEPVAEVLRPVGQGYFTERFFKEVVLRDKDLAASFQALKKRPTRWRDILLIAGGVLLFLFLVGAMISFFANRRLLEEGVMSGGRVLEIVNQDQGKDVLKKEPAAARVEIESADDLRELLARLDQHDQVRPPLYMRFGMYSGNRLNEQLRPLYFDIIEQRFKKPVVRAIESDLRAFAAGNPVMPPPVSTSSSSSTDAQTAAPTKEEILGRHYDLLKAYLMLSSDHIENIEPTFLANQLRDYWKKYAPEDMELLSHQQLDFWAKQANRNDFPHIRVDPQLVSQARLKLQEYPAVNRFYKRITTEINTKVNPINLETILAGRGGGVLNSTYTVPGSFTIEGYRDHVKQAIETANEEISKDDWVMGAAAASAATQGDEIGKLQAMYFREYTDQWRKFVRGMSVRDFAAKEDAVDGLKSLSSTDSPLERVMQEVARNTNLSAKPEEQGWWAWIKSWFVSPEDTATGGNTEVEKEFRPLFQFAQTEKGKTDSAPISQYRAELRRVLDPLETLSAEQLAQTQKALASGKDEIGLQKAEQNVSRMLDPFKTAAAADVAGLLKQPLDNLRVLVYGKGYKEIEKTWREQVYPKAHALESGFPFTDTGESSVTDLARFLNPSNGQFSVFFNERLSASFEDAQGQWKLKESSVFKFSDDFIKYLNSARKLREAMFPNNGQQPEVSYDITLQAVKDTDITLEIDGTRVETRGASPASAKFIWPARSGASGVRMTVLPSGGEPAEKSFPGEWGLFKMFNAGGASKTGDNQYTLQFNIGGVPVKATLRPSSANSPFERSLFTNLRAPANLEK